MDPAIRTELLVDLGLPSGELAPPPRLPLNLQSLKRRISGALPSERAAWLDEEDDPFGLGALTRSQASRMAATPRAGLGQLVSLADTPLSDEVFDSPEGPLTDWSRLEAEARSLVGSLRAKGTPSHRLLSLDNFSPLANPSPLLWLGGSNEREAHAHNPDLVASSPENSPLRPLRLKRVPESETDPESENRVRPRPGARGAGKGASTPDATSRRPPPPPVPGASRPPLKRPSSPPRSTGGPPLSASRRLSSSLGTLPGAARPPRPVRPQSQLKPQGLGPMGQRALSRRATPALAGTQPRVRPSPGLPAPQRRAPVAPATPVRRAQLSTPPAASTRPMARRSMLATPTVAATPSQARRSMLASPVRSMATPSRRSPAALATPTRPRAQTLATPASAFRTRPPTIKATLTGPQLRLKPRLQPFDTPLATPRLRMTTMATPQAAYSASRGAYATPLKPQVLRAAGSPIQPKRRMSGIPSPLKRYP